jgi:GTP-binding protein
VGSSRLPVVAIVGSANVGKSSLFNRLVNKRQAIVAQEAGTTRDSVMGVVSTSAGKFRLLDTAGLKTAENDFETNIQAQITEAAAAADLLIVTVDNLAGPSQTDAQVAKLARKSGKPLILAVNKTEAIGDDLLLAGWHKLGIDTIIKISAVHNQGINELENAILAHIKPALTDESSELVIALVGRPNAGKSSLFNALAKQSQAIVADTAGTTRDVNRTLITYQSINISLLDTAGIRKPGRINRGVEAFSVARAMTAITEADVVGLVIDATEPGVALEQKLAGEVKTAGKGLILIITKWDLVDKDAFTHDQLLARMRQQFQHVPWAMFLVASAKTGQNLPRLLELALTVHTTRAQKFKTSELNHWLEQATTHQPPAGYKRVQPKLKYATQTGINPPQVTIFGRSSRLLHWSYQRYLERTLREQFNLDGTPVVINFRDDKN